MYLLHEIGSHLSGLEQLQAMLAGDQRSGDGRDRSGSPRSLGRLARTCWWVIDAPRRALTSAALYGFIPAGHLFPRLGAMC